MTSEHNVMAAWTSAVRGEIQGISEELANGDVDSWDEYKRLTGRIEGLKRALQLLSDELTFDGDSDSEESEALEEGQSGVFH